MTAQAFNNTLSSSKPSAIGNAWEWWLRTPLASDAPSVRGVRSDYGSLNAYYAYLGRYGVRPALNLPSSLLVSDTTDADGCYTFVWWSPPDVKVKVDGVWRDYSDGLVKIDGAWRKIDEMHTKIDGVWRKS